MRFLSKFIITLTALALAGLTIIFGLTQLLGTADTLSKPLEQGGAYGLIATQLQKQITDSLNSAQASGPVVTSIVSASVTASSVKAATRPTLISIVDWLKTNDSSNPPSLVIDLSSIKSQIVSQARLQGSADVAFVATREIPDSIDPTKDDKKDSSQVAAPPKDSSSDNPLTQIKAVYKAISRYQLWFGIASVVGLGLLVLMAGRRHKQRLKWPASSVFISGLLMLVLIYGIPFALSATILNGNDEPSLVGLSTLRSVLEALGPYGYGLLVIGAIGFAVGQLVMHNPDKRKGKK